MKNGITSQDLDRLIQAFEEQRARLRTVAIAQGVELDLGESTDALKAKFEVSSEQHHGLSEVSAVRLGTTRERLEKIQKLQDRMERKTESAEWPAAPKIQEAIEALSTRDSEAS